MSSAVFAAVLAAALLHAGWNAVVKGGPDKLMGAILIASASSGMAALALPWQAAPQPASWPFIAASSALQVLYLVLLARAYHVGEMSQTYPLMRGVAPLLVAVTGVLWLGERLSPVAWLGIGVLCAGILGLAAARHANGRASLVALLNAVVIASYTLVDGTGIRRSGATLAYILWIFFLTGLPLLAWALAVRRQAFAQYLGRHWRLGLVGGVGSLASYGIALWAMTRAPIAVVAALRETSIFFGTAIAAFMLRERLGRRRIASVCAIAAGAVVLRLA